MVSKGVTKPANLCACSDCHGPTQFARWFETSTAYAVPIRVRVRVWVRVWVWVRVRVSWFDTSTAYAVPPFNLHHG